jgi:hypothetical protein
VYRSTITAKPGRGRGDVSQRRAGLRPVAAHDGARHDAARGPHAGRLIRPARVYRTSPERYATTIYSDDGGRNWRAGKPFAELGTGEAALVELSDGRLLGTARKSYFAEDEPLRHERVFAYSDDGGETWRDAFHAKAIPDGPRYRGTERRGANYNGHFGMFNGLTRLPVAGRDILIYSNADHDGHERVRMTVWASFDGGKTWPVKRLVHEGPERLFVAGRRPARHAERRLDLSAVRARRRQAAVRRLPDRPLQSRLAAGRRSDRRRPESCRDGIRDDPA